MNKQTGSIPFILIFLILIIAAIIIWGWKSLIFVLALFFVITLGVWLYDVLGHKKTCQECKAAKKYIKTKHPDWEVWTNLKSHRAKEDERMIIAVFYRIPNRISRPALYVLVSVVYGNLVVDELDPAEFEKYRIKTINRMIQV